MKCECCIISVKNKLQIVDGVKNVNMDLSNQIVIVHVRSQIKINLCWSFNGQINWTSHVLGFPSFSGCWISRSNYFCRNSPRYIFFFFFCFVSTMLAINLRAIGLLHKETLSFTSSNGSQTSSNQCEVILLFHGCCPTKPLALIFFRLSSRL